MISIGSTDIYIDIPNLSRYELERYSTSLFEEWERYVESHLNLSDYSLSLTVEDGSVKALGNIAVGLFALYIGIGQYGSFISGVQTIKRQVSDASDYLGQRAVFSFSDQIINPKVRKRGEALAKLERIFRKVEAGEVSVDEALEEAKLLFGNEANVPEFYNDLEESLTQIPDHPSKDQLELNYPDDPQSRQDYKPLLKIPRSPRPQKPPIDHYRIVVWRESRNEHIKIKISKK